MPVTVDGVTQASVQADSVTNLGNNGLSDTVRVKQDAIYASERIYATAKFDLSSHFSNGIKDRDQLQIGN